MGGGGRWICVCEAERTGAVGAVAHGNLQRGGGIDAGTAAGGGASLWGQWIRSAAWLFWPGGAGGSGIASAVAREIVSRRAGGVCDPGVCRDDVCDGANRSTLGLVPGNAAGRGRMDRDTGLPECRHADAVSAVSQG